MNDYRLELARKLAATRVVNPLKQKLGDVQKELGMTEGFDVGLEMSGNAEAFRRCSRNMNHGGRVAILGIFPRESPSTGATVIFKGLILKGIYGREMFETWYKMTTMLQSGLTSRRSSRTASRSTKYEQGFDVMRNGKSGKVILEW